MTKRLILLLLCALSTVTMAQSQNFECGYIYDQQEQTFLNSLERFVLPDSLKNRVLPGFSDNSNSPYFVPIFLQWDGSCAQASSIGYALAYEYNFQNQLPANVFSNKLPTHFTYDFLVADGQEGSNFSNTFTVIKELGVPDRVQWQNYFASQGFTYQENNTYTDGTYNSFAVYKHNYWPSGYDIYLNAFKHRVKQLKSFPSLNQPNGLTDLKHYLNHHGTGQAKGGIAVFSIYFQNFELIDAPSPYNPDPSVRAYIINATNGPGRHAMTIVGYDDAFGWDLNGNGTIEADEKGMLKIANSWGDEASDKGFYYIPYKRVREGMIIDSKAYYWELEPDNQPELMFKVNMQHDYRKLLTWQVAGSSNYNNTTETSRAINAMNMSCNSEVMPIPMKGSDNGPFEIALNVADMKIDDVPAKRYFLNINQAAGATGTNNKINSLQLYDYRIDPLNPVIVDCDVTNQTINTGNNTMYIDYQRKNTDFTASQSVRGNYYFYKTNNTNISIHENVVLTTIDPTAFIMREIPIMLEPQAQIVINHLTKFKGSNYFSSEGTMLINADVEIGTGATIDLNSNSVTKIADNTRIVVRKGGVLNILAPSRIEFGTGACIIVEDGASLGIRGEPNAIPLLTTKRNTLNWAGIILENGSIANISNAKIEKALTAISGLPKNLVLKNSGISNCQRGISLAGCPSYEISNNLITGTVGNSDRYYGISIAQSEGTITGNTISNFYNGISLISCSPVVRKNNITANSGYGIFKDGLNSYPDLSAAIDYTNPLNNQISGNVLAQIKLGSVTNINLQNGRNNIYYQDGIVLPTVPCIAGTNITAGGRILAAQHNYWGASTVNDNFFNPTQLHWIDYSNYATTPYQRGNNQASNEAEKLLATADSLYQIGEYVLSKASYMQLIEHFADSPSAYAGCTALLRSAFNCEDNYAGVEQLFNSFSSSDIWTDKDFFSEMQVSIDLFAGNYNSACQNAEMLLEEADNSYETALALIDLSIAKVGTSDRSGQKSNSIDISNQIESLTGMLLSGNFNGLTTDTKNMPTNYRLYNSYPNPFNPTTTIKFDLPASSQVKLSVYDISGRQISILANGILNSGTHSVEFNGAKLASGVYFYQLEAEGKIIGRNKMMLLK